MDDPIKDDEDHRSQAGASLAAAAATSLQRSEVRAFAILMERISQPPEMHKPWFIRLRCRGADIDVKLEAHAADFAAMAFDGLIEAPPGTRLKVGLWEYVLTDDKGYAIAEPRYVCFDAQLTETDNIVSMLKAAAER